MLMITTPHKHTLTSRQAGATLIEILVSVLVIALGLLTNHLPIYEKKWRMLERARQ